MREHQKKTASAGRDVARGSPHQSSDSSSALLILSSRLRATAEGAQNRRAASAFDHEGLVTVDQVSEIRFWVCPYLSTFRLSPVSHSTVLYQTRQDLSHSTSPDPHKKSRPKRRSTIHIHPLASCGTDGVALAATVKSRFSPSRFLSHHPRTLAQIICQSIHSAARRRVAAGLTVHSEA